MLNTPRNAAEILTLQAVLLTGSLVGGVGFGIVGIGIWLQVSQPWYCGAALWGGTGILLGYYGTLVVLNPRSHPRTIPNLNELQVETRVTAVVPDRTEGTIGTFPLPPGELRELARELLIPGVKFTQARYKSKYGLRSFEAIKLELLRRGWATPTYQNSIELTVAGRHVLAHLANPPTPHRERVS